MVSSEPAKPAAKEVATIITTQTHAFAVQSRLNSHARHLNYQHQHQGQLTAPTSIITFSFCHPDTTNTTLADTTHRHPAVPSTPAQRSAASFQAPVPAGPAEETSASGKSWQRNPALTSADPFTRTPPPISTHQARSPWTTPSVLSAKRATLSAHRSTIRCSSRIPISISKTSRIT